MTESHPLEPRSPYAASKLAADKLVDTFHRTFDLPATIVRPFNTYGPGQSRRAVVPTIAAQALAGPAVRLGSLSPSRDLTYVDDTVEGILALGRSEQAVGRTVQLGTGRDVTIGELVELIGGILGTELEVVHDPARVRPAGSEIDRLRSDPSLARELAGWRAEVDLADGLGRTIEWIRGDGTERAEEYAV